MTDKRIYITEASNGFMLEFNEWNPERQAWDSNRPGMVFQDFDVMIDTLRSEFRVESREANG